MLRAATFALCLLAAGMAAAAPKAFQFTAAGHVQGNETRLRQVLTDAGDSAFIVATGIKAASESCGDQLYEQRRAVFDESPRPLVVVPAASDWSECLNALGRTAAVERLRHVRVLFYPDQQTLGQRRFNVTRLSNNMRFRSYAEYAHWEQDGVLFATLNLPSNNNHFRREAGRNSEFEDRAVANRYWLQRVFQLAVQKKLNGLVLFAEADLSEADKQEGLVEVHKQLRALEKNYHGKLLLVDTAPPSDTGINWNGNVGHLSLGATAVQIKVNPSSPTLFSVGEP